MKTIKIELTFTEEQFKSNAIVDLEQFKKKLDDSIGIELANYKVEVIDHE